MHRPRPALSYPRRLRIAAGLALLVCVAAAGWYFASAVIGGDGPLARALSGRGRVAAVGSPSWVGLRLEGTTLIAGPAVPGLTAALDGHDATALLAALSQAQIDGLLIEPENTHDTSLRARLIRYEPVPGLRGLYLARNGALYARDSVQQLSHLYREATAVVARRLLAAERPPSVSSFPEPLRRVRPVEVMVMLRRDGRARLWRSARGSSIASALITAAVIARQRWQEREQAMGGPLAAALPRLQVEVALLEEDGTLGERDPAFIDRVFFEPHGVGYERKGAWRYLLPDATRTEGRGRASLAYRKLFTDDGLPADSFDRHELRLYRLRLQTLAVSEPTQATDAISEVKSPDEILAPHTP